MEGFSGSVRMHVGRKTAATFDSDPPFDFCWAREGSISLLCDNWGDIDNSLIADVYWGIPLNGLLATNANIVWGQDIGLTTTMLATAGTSTDAAGFIAIPQMKSRYMKIVFTLAGTSKTVDLIAWFYGKN